VAGLPDTDARRDGPMTIAMLLQSTLKAARYRRGLLDFPGS
jgi:hypothetical protein